jgi:hypothetical protein
MISKKYMTVLIVSVVNREEIIHHAFIGRMSSNNRAHPEMELWSWDPQLLA